MEQVKYNPQTNTYHISNELWDSIENGSEIKKQGVQEQEDNKSTKASKGNIVVLPKSIEDELRASIIAHYGYIPDRIEDCNK